MYSEEMRLKTQTFSHFSGIDVVDKTGTNDFYEQATGINDSTQLLSVSNKNF